MFYRLFFAGLAFISIINTTHSQSYVREVYTRFVNLGTSNGLSNNIVNDILQDNRGFMWFATENGLTRFDGYEYLNYYHDPADSASIPGNIITSLSTDNQDNLWIGTTEGLCRLSLKDDNIERFMAKPGDINTPRTNHIRKILFSERNNTLWIETFEGTLSALNIVSDKWEHFSHIAPGQPYYRYHALFEDGRGNIWFGGRNTPVMSLDVSSKSIRTIHALGEEAGSKRDDDVGAIFETSNNEWFVTGLDGIYRFYPETEGFKKIYATSTYDIQEDNNGFIWFATGNGLLSLDTVDDRFSHYVYDQYNPLSLTNNRVNCVYVDKDDNIWAGTNNGVSLLSRKSSTFNYYYNIPGTNNSLSSNNVSSIAQDNKGIIYIGTADHGLNIWEYGENTFRRMKSDPRNPCAISSNRVSALYVDSYNKLWVGLWAGIGFDIYDSEYDCFQRYTYDKTSLKRDWYNAFLEDNDGNMLAGMWGAFGTVYFDRDSKKFTQKHFYKADKPYNRPVDRIISNSNGSFFFISEKYPAIFVYDIKSNKYSAHIYDNTFQPAEQSPTGQYNNLPFSFEKITAVSTSGDGLSLFATDKGIIGHNNEKGFFKIYKADLNPVSIDVNEKFIFVLEPEYLHIIDRNTKKATGIKSGKHTFNIVKTVDDKSVIIAGKSNSLYYVNIGNDGSTSGIKQINIINPLLNITGLYLINNTLWLGSQNGLHYYDLQKLFYGNKQELELKQLLDVPVSTITPDSNGFILVFTPVGIYYVDQSTNRISNVVLDNPPQDFNTAAYTAAMVSSDIVWIGSENGHHQISVKTGEVISTNTPSSENISSRLTTCLLQDFEGNLWIGTSDMGLNRVDIKTGIITHFYEGSDKNKIPGNIVNAIIQASDGKIWVATNRGLAYIKNHEVVILGDITAEFQVYSLEESSTGRIWAASDAGLLNINENGQINVFDESFGLPNLDFTTASFKLKNGHLAFGTGKGFFAFDPDLLEASIGDNFYDVWINKFTVFDKPYRYNFKRNDTLELHHSENFFQINFSAASYGIKPGAKYRYQLIGVDPEWVETTENSVSYTGISPGNYMFKISSVSSAGVTDENFSSLMIMIPPPYYQTVWFRVTVFLIIFTGIASYLIIYIRQLKTSRLNIELNQKLLASQMNPHFIFNSLSAIQSFMYLNKPEEAGNFLSSFSRLIRLILENTRSEFIPLKQEIKTLELYLEIQKLRFCDKLDYKINVSPELKESDLLVPPMLAQPFIENSIEHGILHKKGNGCVEIAIDLQNSSIVMIIEDDGVGIESSKQLNLKKRLTHISHSTSITKDRIRNLTNRKNNDYGIKIVDLKHLGKQGTRVELRFPVKTEQDALFFK